MRVLAVLVALLAVAAAFEIRTVDQPNDDKVHIELYYESLCPYCQSFIKGSLKTAFNTKDIWQIADFRAWPYGNARTVANGSSWSFTCQHGPNECVGNIIEACALNLYDWYTQALPFIICIEENPTNWTASGSKCASQLGLNWNDINACSNSPKGLQFHYEIGKRTQALNPPHQYVPWVVVNDGHDATSETAVDNNMVKFICDNYKGSIKIAACGK